MRAFAPFAEDGLVPLAAIALRTAHADHAPRRTARVLTPRLCLFCPVFSSHRSEDPYMWKPNANTALLDAKLPPRLRERVTPLLAGHRE